MGGTPKQTMIDTTNCVTHSTTTLTTQWVAPQSTQFSTRKTVFNRCQHEWQPGPKDMDDYTENRVSTQLAKSTRSPNYTITKKYTITKYTMDKIVYFQHEKYTMRVHESGPADVNGKHDKVHSVHDCTRLLSMRRVKSGPNSTRFCPIFYTILHDFTRLYTV